MRHILIILLTLISINAHSTLPESEASPIDKIDLLPIKIDIEGINRFNNQGKKEGLWVEEGYTKESIRVCYYSNGIISGLCHDYYPYKNKMYLSYVAFLDNMSREKMLINYSEDGLPRYYMNDIGPLSDFRHIAPFEYNKNACQYYITDYYENGQIESEGWQLSWYDTLEKEFYEVGLWKFYDKDGKMELRYYNTCNACYGSSPYTVVEPIKIKLE